MPKTYWVCKSDGTIQCQSNPEIPLDVMRIQLSSLIGENEILNQEKRSHGVIRLCGAPTGQVNAYEITEAGYWVLTHGYAGSLGFSLCESVGASRALRAGADKQEADEAVRELGLIISMSRATSVKALPVEIRELIGKVVRLYTTGDVLTQDYRPDRVNIEVDEARVIVDVWFG